VLDKNWVQSFNLEVELNVLVIDGEPADLLVGLASEPSANAGEYCLCWSQKSSLILQLVSQLDFDLQCKYSVGVVLEVDQIGCLLNVVRQIDSLNGTALYEGLPINQ